MIIVCVYVLIYSILKSRVSVGLSDSENNANMTVKTVALMIINAITILGLFHIP